MPDSNAAAFAAPTSSKLRELAAFREIPRLAERASSLRSLPRGSANIIAIPGFGTTDLATSPLRGFLSQLGHNCVGWGFGKNTAEVEKMLDQFVERVDDRVEATGKPATLIGWSNGGIFAREAARDRPDLVAHVFTYGTPIFGGPKFTRGARFYPEQEVDRIAGVVDLRNSIPIERPITAFYSRHDHVVDWRACIDTFSPDVENIEVRSTHAGMGIDRDVWDGIARRLG